jgi:hypothetical protein
MLILVTVCLLILGDPVDGSVKRISACDLNYSCKDFLHQLQNNNSSQPLAGTEAAKATTAAVTKTMNNFISKLQKTTSNVSVQDRMR